MDYEEIERLHNSGLMPDWYYYQVNGKSAQENYNEQVKKASKKYRQMREERIRQKEAEKFFREEVEKKIDDEVKKALAEIFKDFPK